MTRSLALLSLLFLTLMAGFAATVSCVSTTAAGLTGNGHSGSPSISGDGRYVLFLSEASNLVPNDTNNTWDLFLRDRETGAIERVSVSSAGEQANGPTNNGNYTYDSDQLSSDGRYIVFESRATNLAPNTLGDQNIFLRDRTTGTTTMISAGQNDEFACLSSTLPAISPNGRYIAYYAIYPTGITDDPHTDHIIRYDRNTGERICVNRLADGTYGDDYSSNQHGVDDSGGVYFVTRSTNLVPGANGQFLTYYRNAAGAITLISVAADGAMPQAACNFKSATPDGRIVLLSTNAALVPEDTNEMLDIYGRNTQTNTTFLVSATPDGTSGFGFSMTATISPDGRYAIYSSNVAELVPGDTNGAYDLFVRDLQTGVTRRISTTYDDQQGNDNTSGTIAISADARFVAVRSSASNLIPADANDLIDVFVFDLAAPTQQPDLEIDGPADAEYKGNDIYNDEPAQTSAATTATTASYLLRLGNDGDVAENMILTGPAGAVGWTVRYYDARPGGEEITASVTDPAGWSVPVTPAAPVPVRVEVSVAASVPGGSDYVATITATSSHNAARSDFVVTKTTKQALTSVTLVGSPVTPIVPGQAVTFTATTVGGGPADYRFAVGTYVDGVTTWQIPLPAWQSGNTFTWTPAASGTYRIIVYAREQGTTTPVVNMTVTYVVKPPLSAVALNITPTSPKPLGTTLTLTATPTGGAKVEYEMKARYLDGATPVWVTLQNFASSASVTWTPPLAKAYTIYLTAREQGAAPAQYKYAPSQTYTINAALSALALQITPTSPKALGTTLTLTGTPTGGTKVEYEFKAKYTDPVLGVQWITLQSYTLNSRTITWTPPSARTYTIYATAREQGTATYAYAPSQNYTITPVLSSVSLQVIAPWPRKVNQPITLRGNAVGGAKVEYEFKAKYVEGGVTTWVPIQAFTLGSFQLTWTPTEAHIYTVYVTAREQGSLSATWRYGAQNVSVVP